MHEPFEIPGDQEKTSTEASLAFVYDDRYQKSPGIPENETSAQKSERIASNALRRAIYTYAEKRNKRDHYQLVHRKHIVTQPIPKAETVASLADNFDKLEPIGEKGLDTEATIAIPLAALAETPESIEHTLDLITRSSSDDHQYEVVLWVNAKYTEENESDVRLLAEKNYADIKERVANRGDTLVVRTALDIMSEETFSMSRVRSNYMEAIAVDKLNQGKGFLYPVVWLDNDLTMLSKNAIDESIQPMHQNEAFLSHINFGYTAEGLEDNASKRAVVLAEAVRRERNKLEGYPLGYTEESGLAMMIGGYLMAGGLDATRPMDEAVSLIGRTERDSISAFSIQTALNELLGYDDLYIGRTLLAHPTSARMGMSARRQYELVRREGVDGIKSDTDAGRQYDLYTDMKKDTDDLTPISDEAIIEIIKSGSIKHINDAQSRYDREQTSTSKEKLYAIVEREAAVQRFAEKILNRLNRR